MNNRHNKLYIYYFIAFLLLFSLGLFNYYQVAFSKAILFSPNYLFFYTIKTLLQYLLPILSIVICNKIEKDDHSQNYAFPMILMGIMFIMFASIFFLKNPITYYWLSSYSIITAFCFINLYKKKTKARHLS